MFRQALVFLLTAFPLCAQLPFLSPEILRARIQSTELAQVADINGDGLPDLIYHIDSVERRIDFQLNLGKNIFGPAQTIEPQFSVDALITGDINGDGRPDIAAGSNGIRTYLHNGTDYTLSQSFTDFRTNHISFADINGDGHRDLVYQWSNSNFTSHSIRWRANNGNGIFGEERTVSSTFARKTIVTDVDRDGDLDVIALQSLTNNIVWYPNNGSGTFGAARTIESNLGNLLDMDSADADGDGDPDLIVMAGGQVYLYTNRITSFTRVTSFSNFGSQEFIRFVKGDADALPDLIYKANSTYFYRRNLRGAFPTEITFPNPAGSWNAASVVITDFDGDGNEDLVTTGFGDGLIRLHRNNTGSAPNIVSFTATPNTAASGSTATLSWNVETANSIRIDGNLVTGTSLTVTPGESERSYTLTATNNFGTTTATTTVFVPSPVFADQAQLLSDTSTNISDFDLGDINGDGRADIAFTSSNARQVGWYARAADGSFGAKRVVATLDANFVVKLIDVDLDGDLDIIAGHRDGTNLYRNNGSGTFSAAIAISSMRTNGITVTDLNADGNPDLILTDYDFQPTRILIHNGSNGFLPETSIPDTGRAYASAVGDFNNDGIPDIVTTYSSPGIYLGITPTTFQPRLAATPDPIQSPPLNLTGPLFVADVDGDGNDDIISMGGYFTSSQDNICVMFGLGNGYFRRTFSINRVNNLSDFTAADFNGDLDLDFGFVTRSSSSPRHAGWLDGDGRGNFSSPMIAAPGPVDSFNIKAIDFDKDGDLDLLGSSGGRVFWMRNITEHATPPSIDRFESAQAILHRGEGVELSWDVTGKTTVSIAPDIGVVSGGRITVNPAETTTYILTATSTGGTVTSEITVTVVDRPVIRAFTTDLDNVDRTTPVTLSWQVAGAESLSISPNIGPVTGSSITLPIHQTTTFTLTATNADGEDTKELVVNVDPRLFRFDESMPGLTGMAAPELYEVADFNLDGIPDLIAASRSSSGDSQGLIYWRRGMGDGTFSVPQTIQSNNLRGANAITVGDFNGDGRPDLAIVAGSIPDSDGSSRLLWFPSRPVGQWLLNTVESGISTLTSIHAVDWDGDGQTDILGASIADGQVYFFRNLGSGRFAARQPLGPSFGEVTRITTADIDGNLTPDLIIARNTTQTDLLVLPNLGNRQVGEPRPLLTRGNVRFFEFGDLDGDGDLDLVATSLDESRTERFLNDGNGNFTDPLRLIPTNQVGSGIQLADVDGDGDLDVVWLNGAFTWAENLGDATFRQEIPGNTPTPGVAGNALLGDFDGDGDLDAIGISGEPGHDFDRFENLSTPPAAAPVFESFTASALVILPGQPLQIDWSISGNPSSLTLFRGDLETRLLTTRRGLTTLSVPTETETTQTFRLVATNAAGTTEQTLTVRVGRPPEITDFSYLPTLVNEGNPVTLSWQTERADSILIDGSLDRSGETSTSFLPLTAPETAVTLDATNIFGTTTTTLYIEVNRAPTATTLAPYTATPAADPFEIPTATAFADPDEQDTLTYSITGNSNPAIFTEISIDPVTGILSGGFTDFIDGESLVTIRATDRNALFAETSILITLPRIPDPEITIGSEITLNRQTGLYEQSLRVTNSGARPIGGFRVEITNLPPGVTLRDAPAPAPGEPYVLVFHQPLAPGASIDLALDYFSALRGATPFTPEIAAIQLPDPGEISAPPGTTFLVDPPRPLAGGAYMIEWNSIPGNQYRVEYTDADGNWQASPIIITASSNRLQWIDQGPPKTFSHPSTATTRLYRIVDLSAR